MGANPTQAQGVTLFLLGFVVIAAGLASGGNILYILIGLALVAASCGLFMKAKPWEHREH
jgi:hypothetical protein